MGSSTSEIHISLILNKIQAFLLLFLAVLCLCDSPVLPLCYPKMNNLAQAEILGYKQPLLACGLQNDLWSLLGRHLRKKNLVWWFLLLLNANRNANVCCT